MALETVLDWASWFCIVLGGITAIVGAIGMLRLPDVFSRMHGAGMIDTMGITLLLVGLAFQATEWIVVVKLALIVLFVLLTSPTTTFALSRAAIDGGVDPGPYDTLKNGKKDDKPAPGKDTASDKEAHATDRESGA